MSKIRQCDKCGWTQEKITFSFVPNLVETMSYLHPDQAPFSDRYKDVCDKCIVYEISSAYNGCCDGIEIYEETKHFVDNILKDYLIGDKKWKEMKKRKDNLCLK